MQHLFNDLAELTHGISELTLVIVAVIMVAAVIFYLRIFRDDFNEPD